MKRPFSVLAVRLAAALVFAAGLGPAEAQSTPPEAIALQGRLADAGDNPLTGNFTFQADLYNDPAAGTRLWSNTQTVGVSGGLYTFKLGAAGTIAPGAEQNLTDVFAHNASVWASLTINGETVSPRTQVTAAGYALAATHAARLVAGATVAGNLTFSNPEGGIVGAPNGELNINSGGSVNSYLDLNNGIARPVRLFVDTDGGVKVGLEIVDYATASNNLLRISHDGTDALLENSSAAGSIILMPGTTSGKVGVATASPQARLDVNGGEAESLRLVNANQSPYAIMINNATFGSTDSTGFGLWQGNNGSGNLDVNYATQITILTGGNVGIGLTNPTQKLSVAGTVESTSGGFKFPDGSTQATAAGSGGGTVTSVATGAGLTGGPITTSGTISVATGGITSALIADGTIADADVSATAAIADTKLATISTAGKVADSALSGNVTKLGADIGLDTSETSGVLPTSKGGTGTGDPVTAGKVFAGRTSGPAIAPEFRFLVDTDIPALDTSKIASGTLPVERGGTGTGTAFAAGSVVFAGSGGAYAQNNAQLFWNNTNNRLGIRNSAPTGVLDITSDDGVLGFRVQGAAANAMFRVGNTTATTGDFLDIEPGTTGVQLQIDDVDIMKLGDDGNVGIGVTAPVSRVHVQETSSSGTRGIMSEEIRDDTRGALIHLRKARGTPGSLLPVLNADRIGEIQFRGADAAGASYPASSVGASIKVDAAENWTTASHATLIHFDTVPSGSTGLSNRLQINADGSLSMGSGATCTTGGVWTNASDRNLKEHFAPVEGSDILDKVSRLPISTWNYRAESAGVKHIGPTAQDFRAVFGLGNDDTTISTIDPSGIALAGVQELARENKKLREEVASLGSRLKALEQALSREARK